MTILPLRIVEVKNGIATCDVLILPDLSDKDCLKFPQKDYIWEEREFNTPMFTDKKHKEIFLIKMDVSIKGTSIFVYQNKRLLKKAEKMYKMHEEHMDKSWDDLKESGFFNDYVKPIEINDNDE